MKRLLLTITAAGLLLVSCNHSKKNESNNPQSVFKAQFSTIQESGAAAEKSIVPQKWTEVPALKDAYKNYFDYFGFAVPEMQLNNADIMKGVSYQASCFTCENECKPDFIFNWAIPEQLVDFTAEDGRVYKVPASLEGFGRLDKILGIAKKYKMIMRGHVLVWHNQTPDWFFKEGYRSNGGFVDKATMNARLEWYIKSVLEHVKAWEDKHNGGKRIIMTWDIVNEACTDSAWTDNPLRTESPWFNIYSDDTFIVNAFRYANRYAPSDVKLAYNDYNCYIPTKTKAICKIVQDIRASKDARIDVIGMQSHISMTYPSTYAYEAAVKTFLELGLDVQVTEMEIAFGGKLATQEELAKLYADYFKLFLKYRKSGNNKGICGVTLWGTRDEVSWIRNNSDAMNKVQRPLLFEKDYQCKPAFFSVLNLQKP